MVNMIKYNIFKMQKSQKLRIEKSVKDTTVMSVTTVAFIVFSTLFVLFF